MPSRSTKSLARSADRALTRPCAGPVAFLGNPDVRTTIETVAPSNGAEWHVSLEGELGLTHSCRGGG
jgi:hypothetical protein